MRNASFLVIVLFIAASLVAAAAEAGEVKVVVAVELLEKGELTRVISMEDYHKYNYDFEEFQKLLKRAVTIHYLAEQGWKIAHVRRFGDDYFIFILER